MLKSVDAIYIQYLYTPGLKGPLGASSNRIVRPSVCLSVCPSVCLSVCNSVPITNKVQYLKFGWWYSSQTWTVSSSMGSSHFTDIPCPRGGIGRGQNVGLGDFCHILTLFNRRGHQCFANTSSFLSLLNKISSHDANTSNLFYYWNNVILNDVIALESITISWIFFYK